MDDSDSNYQLIKKLTKELKLNGFSFKKAKKYIQVAEKYLNSGKSTKEFLSQTKNRIEYFALKFFVERVLESNIEDFYIPEKLKTPKPLTRNEIEKMLYLTKNNVHYAIISALYYAGLRLSEAKLLKWKDIDFENEVIYINHDKRVIFLHPKLKEAIQKIKNNSDYIFISSKGKIYDNRTIQQIVTRAAKRAKILKKVTPQTLRHSFAIHLIESGADIRYIQYLLGHKDIRTTQIYVHIANRNIKALAKLI
ncbi:MAG: tyrosine-type recombinase/integrase [Candidatus Aenigmarchaeota archaeon]|nr:tyrosine-type recombinase/integrase [Candidatus Aenigmarchaeota archaeon]